MAIQEVDFGLDNFGKPTQLYDPESVANILIHLLFLKPGQLPSQPQLGIDITQYLYGFSDSIPVSEIRSKIIDQAPYLLQYLDINNLMVTIRTDENAQGILYLAIPLLEVVADQKTLLLGIKPSSSRIGASTFNYKILDTN